MAPNGFVALMVNGPGFENRFGRAKDVFDCPEILVDVSNCLGIIVGVSPQHPDSVVARLGFDPLFVEGKMTLALDFEITPITFVTDQTFITATKLLLQMRDNRLPIVRILTAFFFIETDDITTFL